MRVNLPVTILSIALVLSGCAATERVTNYFKGGSDNAEPPNPLVEFRPLINVIELWKRNNGVGTDEQYLKLAPVVVNQRLYVVDSAGSIGAMDATNGKRLWQKKIDASESIDGESGWFRNEDIRITGGPGYGENTLLVGSMEGEVVSLSAENGSELWRTRVSSEVLSAPQRDTDIVIVRTIDGKVFGID
ncbi:MAG: PQQ-binding-like beta-propeller repeat protein, partial [Gammaproteobacteria bacterium]|nr:PQQ-binding-like beta-propeller repeat protein [Gammaproteobacteria bacterium]